MVTDPTTIRYHLEKAVHLARSGRKGPVWVDIPLDVQAALVDPEDLARFDPGEIPKASAGCDLQAGGRAGHRAYQSRRASLAPGRQRHSRGRARPALLRFLEQRPIPVLTTWMGTDLLYESHPCFFGKPGTVRRGGLISSCRTATCWWPSAARPDFAVTGFDQGKCARGAKKFVVDIDAAEIGKLSLGDVRPVVADARAFLDELWNQRDRLQPRDLGAWFALWPTGNRAIPSCFPNTGSKTAT